MPPVLFSAAAAALAATAGYGNEVPPRVAAGDIVVSTMSLIGAFAAPEAELEPAAEPLAELLHPAASAATAARAAVPIFISLICD